MNDRNGTSPYVRMLQRALCDLIDLAKQNGLNDNEQVNDAKELIRCIVLQCGHAGACDGNGSDAYPCPLRGVTYGCLINRGVRVDV